MAQFVIDLRDGVAQRLAWDHTLQVEPPRFVVVEAETVKEAFLVAGYRVARSHTMGDRDHD